MKRDAPVRWRTGLAAMAAMAPLLCAAAPAPDGLDLQAGQAAYRQCALRLLPGERMPASDARRVAEAAVDQCRPDALALAGRFALAYPGSHEVEHFSLVTRQDLIDELTGWLTGPEPRSAANGR